MTRKESVLGFFTNVKTWITLDIREINQHSPHSNSAGERTCFVVIMPQVLAILHYYLIQYKPLKYWHQRWACCPSRIRLNQTFFSIFGQTSAKRTYIHDETAFSRLKKTFPSEEFTKSSLRISRAGHHPTDHCLVRRSLNASHFTKTKWRVIIGEILFEAFSPFDALMRWTGQVSEGS